MKNQTPFDEMIDQVPVDLRHIIPGFLDRREREIVELSAGLGRGDFTLIKDIGHKLKGTGGGYGLHVISELGREMEVAALRQNIEEIKDVIERLEFLTRNIKCALRFRKDF